MVILLAACGLLAALLMLLAAPLDLTFQLERTKAFRGRISVRWLLGLVRFTIPMPRRAKARPQTKTKRKPKKRQAKENRTGKGSNVITVLRQASFRQRVFRFVNDLVRATHPRQLRLSMRLGLGDPADTGRLWALVGPLSAATQNLHIAQVGIEPDFMDTTIEFNATGQLRFIPLQLLLLIIAFALSPASIKAWRTLNAGDA